MFLFNKIYSLLQKTSSSAFAIQMILFACGVNWPTLQLQAVMSDPQNLIIINNYWQFRDYFLRLSVLNGAATLISFQRRRRVGMCRVVGVEKYRKMP